MVAPLSCQERSTEIFLSREEVQGHPPASPHRLPGPRKPVEVDGLELWGPGADVEGRYLGGLGLASIAASSSTATATTPTPANY